MAFHPGKIEPSRPCHLLLVGGAAYPNLVKWAELLTPVGRPSEVSKKNYDDSKGANILIQHLVGWLKPLF